MAKSTIGSGWPELGRDSSAGWERERERAAEAWERDSSVERERESTVTEKIMREKSGREESIYLSIL